MNNKISIDVWDYFLIGVGILFLPIMGIGLIPIGIAIYRIGHKMEKYKKQLDEYLDKKYGNVEDDSKSYGWYTFTITESNTSHHTSNLKKMKSYSGDTLEEMKWAS